MGWDAFEKIKVRVEYIRDARSRRLRASRYIPDAGKKSIPRLNVCKFAMRLYSGPSVLEYCTHARTSSRSDAFTVG